MQQFPILELLQDPEDTPLTLMRLSAIATNLGVTFPIEYVEFLLTFNGGRFHRPVILHVPNSDLWSDEVRVTTFLGDSSSDEKGNDISWNAKNFQGRVPAEYLKIADSDDTDFILLGVKESRPDFGKVWFWDGTEEAEGNNIYWLADSFNEFLSMLMYDTYNDDFEDEQETIPIFLSIERGRRREVERYLDQGGDAEARNDDGLTLLAAAARYSWPKIVQLLLEKSADVNARDHQGRTPLHHAATSSYDSVKLLVEAGADLQARDSAGKGVVAHWWYRIDNYLRAHGAAE